MIVFPIVILSIENDADRQFMEQLYMEYHLIMYRKAVAIVGTVADADDIVSDACVSLIKKIAKLQKLNCNILKGYVILTVRNTALMRLRKQGNRKEVRNSDDVLPFVKSNDPEPGAALLRRCAIEKLKECIKMLSEGDRAILEMKYFQMMSDSEIGEILGIKEVSVRSRLHRARQRVY